MPMKAISRNFEEIFKVLQLGEVLSYLFISIFKYTLIRRNWNNMDIIPEKFDELYYIIKFDRGGKFINSWVFDLISKFIF